MTNTGRNKKLASFNCDSELWGEFVRLCQSKGTSATVTLTQFIKLYLDGSLNLNLGKTPEVTLGADVLECLDSQVKARVDEYLRTNLPSYIDNYINNLASPTTPANPTSQFGARTKSTSSKKEREFWFIKDRAKFLGLEINANQLIHIELWANEAYKERHGQPPGRQLFRRTQAFAYPSSDVDILDRAIRGVLARG